jgi:hypothetical protein
MGFTIETRGDGVFLIYALGSGERTDPTSLGMLVNNRIPGLAPLYFTQSDEERFLCYSITSKVAIKDFLAGNVNRRRMTGVLDGIAEAVSSAEEYMLDSSLFVLEPEYVYVDVTTCETSLICLPLCGGGGRDGGLREFFRELVMNARYDVGEDCGYVAGIISCLNGEGIFTLGGLRDAVRAYGAAPPLPAVRADERKHAENARRDAGDPGESGVPGESGASAGDSREAIPSDDGVGKRISLPYLLTHYSRENKRLYARARRRGRAPRETAALRETPSQDFAVPGQCAPPISKAARPSPPVPSRPEPPAPESFAAGACAGAGETAALGVESPGETTVLSPAGASGVFAPCLIRRNGGEKIPIDRPVFRIGKEPGYVDYCIDGNPTVSRSNAYIVTRGGVCLIADTNSTNRTLIDGEPIPGGAEIELSHGATVRFSDEEFEFRRC